MKVYIAHSKQLNYLEGLYKPIREDDELAEFEIILPHEETTASNNLREFYSSIDLFIAEVSHAGTGLGIELGWVYDDNVPIHCIYKKGSKTSGSLHVLTDKFYEYETEEELVQIIKDIIRSYK